MRKQPVMTRGPVLPDNQVKTVEKLPGGSLKVTQHSGNTFEVSPSDELFQAFIIYLMLEA